MRKTCIQIVFAVNYMYIYIYIYLSFHRKSMKTDTERQRASQRILSDREKKRDRERERERHRGGVVWWSPACNLWLNYLSASVHGRTSSCPEGDTQNYGVRG